MRPSYSSPGPRPFGLLGVSGDCSFMSMSGFGSQISAMGTIRFREPEFGSLSKREALVTFPS